MKKQTWYLLTGDYWNQVIIMVTDLEMTYYEKYKLTQPPSEKGGFFFALQMTKNYNRLTNSLPIFRSKPFTIAGTGKKIFL